MSESKIGWDPCGSMLLGHVGSELSCMVQGPEKGNYRLYDWTSGSPVRIDDFEDIETAMRVAEGIAEARLMAKEMEESKC